MDLKTISSGTSSKQQNENSLTNAFRLLIKQKDEVSKKYKLKNQQLQELLIKQQSLLNKLNEDNMILSKKLQDMNNKDSLIISSHNKSSSFEELVDQNKSLQEQLLLSQYYGSKMLRELNELKDKLKKMTTQTNTSH